MKNTYSVLFRFALFYIMSSMLVRTGLLLTSHDKAELTLFSLARIFSIGLIFDIGVAAFTVTPYALYLLILPVKFNNALANKIITYTCFVLAALVMILSFFAEFTFWQEFESRFNFIAVDYLVYTYEVVSNINESYPLPLLIGGVLLLTFFITFLFARLGYFAYSFQGTLKLYKRAILSVIILAASIFYVLLIPNSLAEKSRNRVQNELAKAGIFSFFAAFKNNDLSYQDFYKLIPNKQAFEIVRNELNEPGFINDSNQFSISRHIPGTGEMLKPNVIMITIESFSAEFMGAFGNTQNLTPNLDSFWKQSIHFDNLYATGTRTVRGMEALSLCIPPTPGSSIVRRKNNDSLCTVGNVFKAKGYENAFFYGGDGYFDNMNQFFGGNGYTIYDKGREALELDHFAAGRNTIPDSLVHFQNAWGICDEDLYDAVLQDANLKFRSQQPFYDFVMTTSNHRPFTFPAGKIDIPPGAGRDAAVKYTDYAVGAFIRKASSQPWFANTIFIFVADHCANSAGKTDIDISKYQIPAMIWNLPHAEAKTIDKLCSQIDLYPTLFALLHWNYESNFFGKDVLSAAYEERSFVGTYQRLAYIKKDSVVVLSPHQKTESFHYNKLTNEQTYFPASNSLINEAIAYYQTADYLYKNGGLKQKRNPK
ncbi:MAG: sulfatase-like hydrolase/transferase [Ferruginibacter sp.]|nr:sulfatase-like hydrolase/transferase [Ferruginibacter sp.]